MIFLLIPLYLIFQLTIATNYTLSDLKQFKIIPYAELKQSISANDNTTTIKTQSFQNYFYRLDSNKVIKVWNITDPNSCIMICNVSSPYIIQDFSIDVWNGQFAYVDGNKNVKVIYPNCTENGTFHPPYSTLNAQIFLSYTYVTLTFRMQNTSDRGNNQMFKYQRSSFSSVTQKPISGNNISATSSTIVRYSYCVKPPVMGVVQFFFVYLENSYFVIFGEDHRRDGPWSYGRQDDYLPPNNYSWSIKSVTFNYDCSFIYVVYDAPINKVALIYHDHTRLINQIYFTGQIHAAVSFDQKKWMMAVFFKNNSVVFYNVSNTTMANDSRGIINSMQDIQFLFQQNLTNVSSHATFSRSTSMFYVNTDSHTQGYQVKCPSGIKLGMGLCLDTFDEAVQQNSKSSELKYLFAAFKVMAFLISFMQVTPFAGVFLRFINFWTICSIYSMVNIKTQEPLRSILYQIYQLINASLFQLLGIQFNVSISNEQKVTDLYLTEYQITSNFAPTVIQPIVCTIIMCIFLYVFEFVKHKFFSEYNKKKFHVSKLKIFFGQYVSFLSIFMFPLKFVYLSMNQLSYDEKWNQTFHMIFICIGLMIPFVLIFLNGKKLKKVKKTGKSIQTVGFFTQKSFKNVEGQKIIQQQVSVLTFEYLEFTYISLVNIIMPILGTITTPYWFAIICGVLILCGIIVDSKRSQWRLNSIILSSELFIFHLCFCINLINFSDKSKYVISIIAMGVLMIGALHQVLTLLARVCTDIFTIFCKKAVKVGDDVKHKKKQLKSIVSIMKSTKQIDNRQKIKKIQRENSINKSKIKLKKENNKQAVTKNQIKVEQINPGNIFYEQEFHPQRKTYKFVSMKSKQLKNKGQSIDKQVNKREQNVVNKIDNLLMTRSGKTNEKHLKIRFETNKSKYEQDEDRQNNLVRHATTKKSTLKQRVRLKLKSKAILEQKD